MRDDVELARKLLQFAVDRNDFLRGRQAAQGIAHFRKASLQTDEGAALRSCVARLIDSIGELAYLALQRFHRFARQRVLQHDADLGEVITQGVDGLVHPAGLFQTGDLRIDGSQLLFEPGHLLRSRAWQRVGGWRRARRFARRFAVQCALPVGYFEHGLIERSSRLRWRGSPL
jgi:hypothetical protein